MGGAPGARLCPQAVVVPPRMTAYSEASKAVFAIFRDTSPLVEGLSIDEAFLDVRGLRAHLGHAARDRRRAAPDACASEVGLPITVGVARTKFLAKVASAVAKPDGLLVVPARRRAGVPAPAPGRAALGRRRRRPPGKLHAAGSRPSARSPRVERGRARRVLGRGSGRHLHALAHNRDPRPVRTGRRRRLDRLAARARPPPAHAGRARRRADRARRPRSPAACARARRVCRTVVLRLRFGDFTRATRSHTLPEATANTGEILATRADAR